MKLLNVKNLFGYAKPDPRSQNQKKERRIKGKSLNQHLFGGCRDRNLNAIYMPQHGKFKGWMRERRRCTFNKNRMQ